jgi:hypothetical protein
MRLGRLSTWEWSRLEASGLGVFVVCIVEVDLSGGGDVDASSNEWPQPSLTLLVSSQSALKH